MVKYYERLDTINFSWFQVAKAFWQRYPNPFSKHVLTEDVIQRKMEGNKLISKRLLTKTNVVPKWAKAIVGEIKDISIIEESIVDLDTHTITTYTRNINMQRIMNVEEKCIYKISEDNHQITAIKRKAWITSNIFGFRRTIQTFGVERFKSNSVKANKGLTYVLNNLFPPSSPIHNHPFEDKLKETAKKASEIATKTKPRLIVA